MKKIFAVARWEFVEKIKTRTFLISLIISQLIIILFTIGGQLISSQENDYTKTIGVIDTSGIYFFPLKTKTEQYTIDNQQPAYMVVNLAKKNQPIDKLLAASDSLIIRGVINGVLHIKNSGTDSVSAEFRSKAAANFKDVRRLEQAYNEITTIIALERAGINPELINKITSASNIVQVQISEAGEEKKTDFITTFFSSIIFILMLMTLVISSGGMLIRSLVEEKSNKLIDIIISSCTPDELLAGKIFGLSLLGFVQILIWAVIGILLTNSALISADIFSNIFMILIFFVLGFIFYTSLFVGIGSIVSTEQEAQQITGYLSMILVLPVILAIPAIENPDTMIVKILSYF